MQVNFQIDSNFPDQLNQLLNSQIPRARLQLVQQLLNDALSLTIDGNPVRTGRSRAAWEACLAQLDGGGSAGDEGTIEQTDDEDVSTITATNLVDYVPFLEYGTSHMAPFSMVRDALDAVAQSEVSLPLGGD